MFGRKVFFLNPPLSVENFVVDALKANEYEVYIIRDYTLAKPVLEHFENAICFIYIDDELALDGWYNFIKSFETDKRVKTVFLGVLSVKTKPKDQERFLMELKLPGGFVRLDQKTEDVCKQLDGILNINGAKGVRKVIRLDLKGRKDVNGYFGLGTVLYSFRLIDISSMGFAAVIPSRMLSVFKKGILIHNVSITMERFSFISTIQVRSTNMVGDSCIVVAMFADDTPPETRKKIHDFVYANLELNYRSFIEGLAHDFTSYSSVAVASAAAGNVEEAEEVQEKENTEETKSEEGVKTPDEKSSDSAPSEPAPSSESAAPVSESSASAEPASETKSEPAPDTAAGQKPEA